MNHYKYNNNSNIKRGERNIREVHIGLPIYHYRLLIPIFKESDLSIGKTKLILLAKRWIKVVVAVVEVKSEPL